MSHKYHAKLHTKIYQEYDHPHILLQNPEGLLTSMIGHTGKASSEILRRVAAEVIFKLNISNPFVR